MADGSGGTGLLGVIIGAIIVIGLGYFFLGDRIGIRAPPDVNVKDVAPPTPKN